MRPHRAPAAACVTFHGPTDRLSLLRRSLQDFEAKSKRGDGMGGRKEVRDALQ